MIPIPKRLVKIVAIGLIALAMAWTLRAKLSVPAPVSEAAQRDLQAVATMEQSLAAAPHQAELRYQLGTYYLKLQRADDARRLMQDGCRLAPYDPQAWLSLGDLETLQGQTRAASAAYEKAVALAPDNAVTLCALAQLELKRGRLKRASQLLDRAAAADKSSGRVPFIRAQLLMRTAPAEVALPELRRAVKLEPQLLPAWLLLADISSDLNQTADMEAACRGALSIAPSNPDALTILSRAKMQSGVSDDLKQARDLAEQALAANPQHGAAHAILGILDLRAGRSEAAVEHLENALLSNRGDIEVRANLAKAYQRAGRAEEAKAQLQVLQSEIAFADRVRHLTTQSKMRPRDADLHRQLGDLYASAGNKEKAIAQYEATLELDPKHQAARSALAKLGAAETRAP